MNKDDCLVNQIYNILEDKKALDIKIMEVSDKTTLADYFIIASGTSNTHIKSLAQEIIYQLKKNGILPNSQEGTQTASWILLDYGQVIVHIFSEEMREFYNLEHFWGEQ